MPRRELEIQVEYAEEGDIVQIGGVERIVDSVDHDQSEAWLILKSKGYGYSDSATFDRGEVIEIEREES